MDQPAILILFLIFLGLTTNAQEYSYKRYTVDDGLPTNAVYGGIQDSRGYIWFYTEKGIARFDGYEFKAYTIKDGLPTNDIFYLLEDQHKQLWLHSFAKELVLMDLERDSFFLITKHTSISQRFHIFTNGENVWTTNSGTLHRFVSTNEKKIDTIIVHHTPVYIKTRFTDSPVHQLDYNRGIAFAYNSDQAYIISTDKKSLIDSISLKNFNENDINHLLTNRFVSSHAYKGDMYLRSPEDSLIYRLDLENRNSTKINLKQILGETPNFVRYQIQDDQLQIQTELGMIILNDHSTIEDVFLHNLPTDVMIDRSFKDRRGNIWITSRQKGVYFLTSQERNTSLINFPKENDKAVTSIALYKDQLFLGTQKGNLYTLHTNDISASLLHQGSAARYNDATNIKSIAITNKELWFIRQSDGIFHFDFETNTTYSLKDKINEGYTLIDHDLSFDKFRHGLNLPQYLTNASKDLFWIKEKNQLVVARGAFSHLCSFDKNKTTIQFLTYRRTYSTTYDKKQTIWLGHNDGLGSFKNNSYTFHDDIELLNGKNIWDLEVGNDNTLWAGTDGYGLVAYDGQNAFSIPDTEKDIVQDIFISEDGYIWIATNYGVKQIEQKQPLAQSVVVNTYNVNSGLVTREANCIAADSQYIFVGTNEGLTRINRQMIHYDSTAPTLYLDQILINGEKTENNTIYHLTHDQNELEFFFTALSYKSFGNIQYEYQLIGADRSTITTTNRSARYSNLAPGTYTFNLIATDIQGNKSLALNPVKIIISPPWWKTKLFYATLILAITAIIIGIYLWRVRNIQKKAEWETNINKQFAALELQALQAQMNPHFVFNSLGAIQYFIQTNKKEQADNYLAEFGHLMRLFLESSKNKYISLAEEIKLLNLYIRLEKIRFKQKFDYQLAVAENISAHNTFLPSMLLQPFVENAINHGLFHKEGKGLLSINIQKEEDGTLKCIIKDNGIGREKAGEIKKLSKRNYKSRATQITEERLDALRQFEDFDIQFEIEDLFDQAGNPNGTRVIIVIPEID